MIPFLAEAVKTIQSKHASLSEVVVVLPSKRAKVFLVNHLLQQIESPQFSPQIYSIEEFVAVLSQLKKAPQIQQLFTLYGAYKQCVAEEYQDSFEEYLQWASRLLKDFNDIDAYQVDAAAILSNVGEYYALESINDQESETAFDEVFWKALPEIYSTFKEKLIAKQWGTMGMLYVEALDALQIYLDQSNKQHYFVGFNALNTSEEFLFQEFLTSAKGEVLWDLDKVFYEDAIHASSRFIRRYQQEWNHYRKNPSAFTSTHFSHQKNINAVGFSGSIEQAQYVGKLLHKSSSTPNSTAVVLGDESMLLPILSHLPLSNKHWNVTMGYPIAQLPISHFFIDFLTLHASYNEEGFERKLLMSILNYPPVRRILFKENGTAKEDLLTLEHQYSQRTGITSLKNFDKGPLGKALFNVPLDASLLLDQCVDWIDQLIEYFSLHKSTDLTQATLLGLRKLAFQTQVQVQTEAISVSISSVLFLLKEGVQLQTIDFKGDPVQGLQLMGMLETRVLDFETVIITNVNEGILPVGKNDQSFFPFSLKKHFGLPTFLDNDAIYTYHFYRILQRAKNIHLLYNATSEGLNAGEKSRFIRQLELTCLPDHNFTDQNATRQITIEASMLPEVKKNKAILTQLRKVAAKGFSPTSLSSYLVNPMDFYERYVLGVKPPIEVEKVLSNFQRGTIVHNTLEELYAPFVGKPMQVLFYKEMLLKLSASLLNHYANVYPKSQQPIGENHLIVASYERSIKAFLTQEMQLVEQGASLTILEVEKEFSVDFFISTLDSAVKVGGTIDRVDRFNGVLRFIDYKTGLIEKTKLYWNGWEDFLGDYKRQPLFQVLLYAWSQQAYYSADTTFEAGIISLKTPMANVIPVLRKDLPKTMNQHQMDANFTEEFEQFLKALIEEIFDVKKSFVYLENGKD